LEKADSLVNEYGTKIVPIRIDYNDPKSFENAANQASDAEIVVSNAGVLQQAKVLDDAVIETFQKELEVNVYGLLRMAKAFAPVLKANGGGVFVQLNSVASLKSFPDFATYCASKASAYSFTQALRDSLAEQGTHVLSVHPGPIATDMAQQAGMGDMGDPVSVVSDGIVKALKSGNFHLFPDTMAKQFEESYKRFAQTIIEAGQGE
jgi:short-subunit dehydrogenase